MKEFQLIYASSSPSVGTSKNLFIAFLSAELEPGVSVEHACHANLCMLDDADVPPTAELFKHRRLLRACGICYVEPDLTSPGYAFIEDVSAFTRKFPHLAHVVPFVVAGDGVWLASGGTPVRKPKIGAVQ